MSWTAVAGGALLLALARPAFADRQSTAAAIFEQGIRDLQAGKLELACRELANSIATWPDSGAKGALAECETQRGKLATAWRLWQDLATSAPSQELRDDAAAQARGLEPRLPRLVIRLRADAPRGLRLTLDGQRIAVQTAPLPVDPGDVVVAAEAPRVAPWAQTVTAAEGATITVDVPLVAPPLVLIDHSAARRRRHITGYAVGGAGLALIGVGAVFGVRTFSTWDRVKDACEGMPGHCPTLGVPAARRQLDDARSSATWSSVLVGAGLATIAAGAIVYLTAPRDERVDPTALRVTPVADDRMVGLALTGALR